MLPYLKPIGIGMLLLFVPTTATSFPGQAYQARHDIPVSERISFKSLLRIDFRQEDSFRLEVKKSKDDPGYEVIFDFKEWKTNANDPEKFRVSIQIEGEEIGWMDLDREDRACTVAINPAAWPQLPFEPPGLLAPLNGIYRQVMELNSDSAPRKDSKPILVRNRDEVRGIGIGDLRGISEDFLRRGKRGEVECHDIQKESGTCIPGGGCFYSHSCYYIGKEHTIARLFISNEGLFFYPDDESYNEAYRRRKIEVGLTEDERKKAMPVTRKVLIGKSEPYPSALYNDRAHQDTKDFIYYEGRDGIFYFAPEMLDFSNAIRRIYSREELIAFWAKHTIAGLGGILEPDDLSIDENSTWRMKLSFCLPDHEDHGKEYWKYMSYAFDKRKGTVSIVERMNHIPADQLPAVCLNRKK